MVGGTLAGSAGGGPELAPPVPPVPSRLGRRVLLFEFVVLAEYWIAPTLFDLTNYAGVWSELGNALFILLVGTLAVFVLVPLGPHLRGALGSRRDRLVFYGVWGLAWAVGLFATSAIQLVGGSVATSGAVELGRTVVYTPFGAWTSLTVLLPDPGLYVTLNVEVPLSLGLLAVLSASAVLLGPVRQARACARGAPRQGLWRDRVASLAIWSPFGFVTGCASCTPAYLAAIGLLVPGVAATGYADVPLVPWIGLAGLLYLASLVLAIVLIGRATRDPATERSVEEPDEEDATDPEVDG